MPSPRVLIELNPNRVSLTRLQGKQAGDTVTCRFDAPLPDFSPARLQSYADRLKALVLESASAGDAAVVVATGPKIVGIAHSAPGAAGAGAAVHAARLALESAIDFSLDTSPSQVLPIVRDAGNGTSQIHLVAMATEGEILASIAAFVRGAGLVFQGLIPNDALRAACAVRNAASERSSPGTLACLHLDSDAGVLTASRAGRLQLVRSVSIGLDALTDALMRPIRTLDDSQPTVNLSREQAERLLFSTGIPAPDATIPISPPVRGSALLPALQPVLQRLGVEVKQSLRFGLDEAARAAAAFRLAGAAGDVPRLQEVLAGLIGIPPVATGTPAGAAATLAELYASTPLGAHALMPVEHQQRVYRTRVRTAAVVGAAIACAWTAFDALSNRSMLRSTQLQLDALSTATRQADRTAEVQRTSIAARGAMNQLSQRISAALSGRTDWTAFLAHVSVIVPDSVKLRQIHCQHDADGPTATIAGTLPASDDRLASQTLGSLMDQLAASPMVRAVRLASTGKRPDEQGVSQSFELTLRLNPVAPSPIADTIIGSADSKHGPIVPGPKSDAYAQGDQP